MRRLDNKDGIGPFKDLALEMKERRKSVPPIEKLNWFYRHWKSKSPLAVGGRKNKNLLPPAFVMDVEWDEWMQNDLRNPYSLAS